MLETITQFQGYEWLILASGWALFLAREAIDIWYTMPSKKRAKLIKNFRDAYDDGVLSKEDVRSLLRTLILWEDKQEEESKSENK